MKKIFLFIFLMLILSSFSGGTKITWQGAYYDGGNQDSNIIYGPVFTNYDGCKDWALNKTSDAYNNYTYCSKNCSKSMDGTPICEEVVRGWQPLPGSNTFDNYKE